MKIKNYIFYLFIIITNITYCQRNAELEKDFFTVKNTKLALTLGADISLASENGGSGMIISQGTIEKENLSYSPSPNISYSLGFDIYSPTSKLGFFIEPTYNIQNHTIINDSAPLKDSISSSNIEIPVYLKFRLGNPLSRSQFWFAMGGGYSFPLEVSQNYYEVSSNNLIATLDKKDMLKSIPYLSSIIGYELNLSFSESDDEIYERDGMRMLFFVKGNYDLGNRINEEYTFGTDTSLGHFDNPELKFLRISFGIKILLRVSKFVKITKDVVSDSLKKNGSNP